MRRVKWIDEKTGGWKTGVVMVSPSGQKIFYCDELGNRFIQVKESHCGTISWPLLDLLQDMPTHEELENAK